MGYPQDQIDELKETFGSVLYGEEGGYSYFLIPSLQLPEGCEPQSVDALLCPMERNGYPSRLFFGQEIKLSKKRNWNVNNERILEKNWWAFSWKLECPNLRLIQMIAAHLRGLR